jgi:serine/threonine protein kinase
VLVFKDATRKTIVKVCDFGYSTLAASEGGSVLLPKSRPWNAPEHHFGEFKVSAAKKADVYSFGMLCLWLLFGSVRVAQNGTDSMPEIVSFDASTGPRTWLECLKDEDKLQNLATQLLALTELNTELSIRLKEFFDMTIPLNPEKRTPDLGKLLHLLSNER